MNLRVLSVLFIKEVRQGAHNFFLAYAIFMPIALSLLVTLVFGDLFASGARLGVLGANADRLASEAVEARAYDDEAALRADVARGALTSGVIVPSGFDAARPRVTVLHWQQATPMQIAAAESAIDSAFAPAPPRITLQEVQLGEAAPADWSARLLPLIVLMTIILSGVMVPAASLVGEKSARTLHALSVSPASLLEVYLAKALLGMVLGGVMGVVVLLLNNALGGQPGLLIALLLLGAAAASLFGVILGSLVNSVNALLAALKTLGLVLFAPALVGLVPAIPEWVARLFPTYYIMQPVLSVTQQGADAGAVAGDAAVLLAIVGGLCLALAWVVERQKRQLALIG
jgi:ABC-2 type transport system permease protein